MDANFDSPNLDLLRSGAVLFVVFFHVLLLLEKTHYVNKERLGGFHSIGNWGVLIFFVHTSLVLMFSLERQYNHFPEGRVWFQFLIRRIFRIYPLSMCIVTVVALFRIPVADIVAGRLVSLPFHWPAIVTNLLLIQNLTNTPSILIPLWSLPFEMQMYLFLPALYLFVRNSRSVAPIFLVWMASYIAAKPAARLDEMGIPNLVEFAPLFLSGIVAYSLIKTARFKLPAWVWPFAIAAITVFYLFRPIPSRGCVATLLLGVALPHFKEISSPAIRTACRIVARYSYGIYLTHIICIWLAFQACAHLPVGIRIVVFLTTVISFPVISYHAIEAPMIKAGTTLIASLRAPKSEAVVTQA